MYHTILIYHFRKGCHRTIWIGWISICRKINDAIEVFFENLTRFITNHHRLVMVACLVFFALMIVGGWRFKALQRNEELFIPQGSQAFKDLDKGQKLFHLKYRLEEVIVSHTDGSSIFNDNKIFLKVLDVHEKIIKLKNFQSTCIKNYKNECEFVSVLDIFNYSRAEILAANTSTKILSKFNAWLNDPTKLLKNGRNAGLNYVNILGRYKQNTLRPASVLSADAVRMTYYMVYAHTTDDIYDTIANLENRYITVCKDLVDTYKSAGYNLFYYVGRTSSDAILNSTISDIPLFSVAFILMILFCLVVFLRIKNPVSGHLTVGILGIFVIMCGVLTGFGLAMWTGNDFVAFTLILFFLILGIGK